MQEACLFDVMQLPKDSLKRILPRFSTRMMVRLLEAYPRTIGRTLLNIASENMSAHAIQFLKEEMFASQMPTLSQIHEAEKELLKIVYEEKLLPHELAGRNS
jgi:flagellar motor switch protein FliG